jgi:hypothetical protein
MAGGAPSGLIHSETGFNATTGWNRLLLATPQEFPPAAERGVVLKIVNNSSTSVYSRDNSRMGSGRSYTDADGLGTFSTICVGPGETCGDLNIVTLLGPDADTVPPGISISAPSVSSTTSGPVTYTITYTEADNITLAADDVALNVTGTANGTVGVSGSGNTTRLVTISAISGVGTLGISIASGTASDAANNMAEAAGPSATFTVGQPELIFKDSFE